MTPKTGSTVVVDWWELSPAARVAELDELRLFVGRLVAAYGWPETIVPPCWERHEAAVRLLDALHRAYVGAMLPGQGGDVLVLWHRNAAFIRDELGRVFYGLSCGASHNETVSASSVQSWAADVADKGKASKTWKTGREEALADYRRMVAESL